MATYDLTANTKTSYNTFSSNDITILNKIQNLENKVNSQSEKLDQIVKLLDDLSKEKSTT
jgi:ABC-type transporter Mla subunit MlaD